MASPLLAIFICCLALHLHHAQASVKLQPLWQQQQQQQCPRCPGRDQAPPPGQFNFYFLVRQWPSEFCYTTKCSVEPDEAQGFTLHGLWPNLDNPCADDYPEYCSEEEFNVNNLSNGLYDDMKAVWPSYTTDNECFWSHEWSCHGSCSGLKQEEYFQNVVTLHKNNDIATALKAHGIEPSDQPVSRSDFLGALSQEFGATPLIFCDSGRYIAQVFMCVDQSFNVVDCSEVCVIHDCTPKGREACGSSIIYKLSDVRPGQTKPCTDDFSHCDFKEKSGTCVPSRGDR